MSSSLIVILLSSFAAVGNSFIGSGLFILMIDVLIVRYYTVSLALIPSLGLMLYRRGEIYEVGFGVC